MKEIVMVKGIQVALIDCGDMCKEEIEEYADRAIDKYGDRLMGLEIKLDGEYVDLDYQINEKPFQRLRRITGYLVGSMDKWNDAKHAEEADQVKHI